MLEIELLDYFSQIFPRYLAKLLGVYNKLTAWNCSKVFVIPVCSWKNCKVNKPPTCVSCDIQELYTFVTEQKSVWVYCTLLLYCILYSGISGDNVSSRLKHKITLKIILPKPDREYQVLEIKKNVKTFQRSRVCSCYLGAGLDL